MTDRSDDLTDAELECLFEAARLEAPTPSEAMLRRIEADALRQTALRQRPQRSPVRRNRLAELMSGLGHRAGQLIWPLGLSAVTLTGVWFGVWADSSGLINPRSLVSADVAYELAYQLPSLTGYLEGY